MFIQKLAIIILSLFFSFLNAQEKKTHNPFFLNLSIGGSKEYLNAGLAFNKTLENYSYQIGYNVFIESILSSRSINKLNISIGKTVYENWYQSSIYIGPAYVMGEKYDSDRGGYYFNSVGISINTQLYSMALYKLFPGLAIGIEIDYYKSLYTTKEADFDNVFSFRLGFCITDLHK